MAIPSGRVVADQIVLDGDPLPDGAAATVLTRELYEPFEVDAAMEAELVKSLGEADRGETVSAEEVTRALRNQK